MTRRRALAAVAALAAVTLAGCAPAQAPGVPNARTFDMPLEDGRTVTCVTRGGGGLSCDWDNAR